MAAPSTPDEHALLGSAHPVTRALLAQFPCVMIDNASIHHNEEFVEMVESRGGQVWFIPPYCHLLSTLDNGAFGLVCRELVKERGHVTMYEALEKAFCSITEASARHCHYNCGWGDRQESCPYEQLL